MVGIHTRLSAEIIENAKQVDGLIVWDWLCGTVARPCPKIAGCAERTTDVGGWQLPPPCIYLLPRTIPSVRNNPCPKPQSIDEVEILKAFHDCFSGKSQELHSVSFAVAHKERETVRSTVIERDGELLRRSDPTAIRRS